MHTRNTKSLLLAMLLPALALAAGCASGSGHGATADCQWLGSTSMCFGYNPTCWRPWPAECPPCLPFTNLPPAVETVSPPPAAGPATPGGDVLPLPPAPMTPNP